VFNLTADEPRCYLLSHLLTIFQRYAMSPACYRRCSFRINLC
jgi:hypothetical protein